MRVCEVSVFPKISKERLKLLLVIHQREREKEMQRDREVREECGYKGMICSWGLELKDN